MRLLGVYGGLISAIQMLDHFDALAGLRPRLVNEVALEPARVAAVRAVVPAWEIHIIPNQFLCRRVTNVARVDDVCVPSAVP